MGMRTLLAVDAGGTSTRAVVVDGLGRCHGYGQSAGGNPTSSGLQQAVDSIVAAAAAACAPPRPSPGGPTLAVIALAGERSEPFTRALSGRLGTLGVTAVLLEPDLLGMFHSGTPRRDGYALVAGTGAIAARVRGGRVERVAGGNGWLLGDTGSGFWIGQQVARAVVAALDDVGPPTALTSLVLDHLGIADDATRGSGRPRTLEQVVSALYAWRPVQLSQLAPLAFRVPEDAVAGAIIVDAAAAVADLLAAVHHPDVTGPTVVGGSALVRGLLCAPASLRGRLAALGPVGGESTVVNDGVVGAAVLALRHADVLVDDALFDTLRTAVHRARTTRPT